MKKVSVLGCTGSIGMQALDVIEHSDRLCAYAVAANKSVDKVEKIARKFNPQYAAMYDEKAANELKIRLADTSVKVLSGLEGVCEAACVSDTALTAMSGSVGIMPTLAAVKEGKEIALANKETMVCAGDIINREAEKSGSKILPVDSEHGAIFQCIRDERKFLKKILLTASGGPFFGKSRDELKNITPADALKHPNWDMGAKITIDSATLFNKGLEVIEAVRLFGVLPSQIEVLVHRQSIVHSMVCFEDNSVIAQLGNPDMRIPIAYALNYPDRCENPSEEADFFKISTLTFEKPDTDTFRGLYLAYKAIETGGSMPAVYNGANEAAVAAFLEEKCSFLEIAEIVEKAMDAHKTVINPDLESIIDSDRQARGFVESYLKE